MGWHPPVGVFIALLAVVGVLVPWFRGSSIGPREKAFWTFLMFLFVGLEIRSIYLDRAENNEQQAQARDRELKSFSEIAKGIDATIDKSQKQFEVMCAFHRHNDRGIDSDRIHVRIQYE